MIFLITQARVVLYKGGNPVKQLTFNASGTDNVNWFQFDKLTENPWPDMALEARNRFHIEDTGLQRSFIINSVYNDCPNDVGWMMITGTYCSWERPRNTILYSKGSVRNKWDNNGIKIKLVVFFLLPISTILTLLTIITVGCVRVLVGLVC